MLDSTSDSMDGTWKEEAVERRRRVERRARGADMLLLSLKVFRFCELFRNGI